MKDLGVVLLCDAVSDDSVDDNSAGDSDGGPRGGAQNQIAEGGAIEERCSEDASALAAGGADNKLDACSVMENCAFELTGAVGGCACHTAPASGDDGGVCRSASPPRATPVFLSALLCMHLPAPSSPSHHLPSLPPPNSPPTRRDITAAIVVHRRGQLQMLNCIVTASEQAGVICHGTGQQRMFDAWHAAARLLICKRRR
jgi:hypothetical protein